MNNINNPIQQLILAMQSGGNPQVVAQQLLQQNPQLLNGLQQVKNMVGNRSPTEFAMQLAKQQGMDTKQIEQLLNYKVSK